MAYRTKNEFDHFKYEEAQIAEAELLGDSLHLCLDNVHILPDNSANRDIRTMRCNGLILRFHPMEILSAVREGYRTYNADGKLLREDPDTPVEDVKALPALMAESPVVSFTKNDDAYTLVFDGNDEQTYALTVRSDSDTEEWERFLNL